MKKLIMVFSIVIISTIIIFAQSSIHDPNIWVTNGWVSTIAVDGDYTYVGGNFSYIGPNTGYGAKMNTASDIPDISFPKVNGSINVIIPDGSGGWLIGGGFTKVGTYNRNNIAKINSDGSVDVAWEPNANGLVSTIVISGSDIYVGGGFTSIGGASRNRIAKLNNTTGTADPSWNPSAGSIVNTIAINGSDIFVGGNFTTIGGVSRNRIAKLNTTTGAADPSWNPSASSTVNTIAINASDIYVGGNFTTIGGVSRNRIAKLNTTTGAADPSWNPDANTTVRTIIIDENEIYVGGNFYSIGGETRPGLAKLDNSTGAADLLWVPNPNLGTEVYTVNKNGSDIYVGGIFTSIGGGSRNRIAKLNNTTGATDLQWDPNANGRVSTIAIDGNDIYVGGDFTSLGGESIASLAKFSNITGIVDPTWNPSPNGDINTIYINGSDIYIGGLFTSIGGQLRRCVARLNNTTGAADPLWNPDAYNRVYAIAVSGSDIYVGGSFLSIFGVTRRGIAKLNNTTGAVDLIWNPNPNGDVNTIAINGSDIYAGGTFNSIGGATGTSLAKLNITTGGADPSWNANVFGVVHSIIIDGSNIYAGGGFTTIGGVARHRIGKINLANGNLDRSWNPNINSGGLIYTIANSGSDIYVGGIFTSFNGMPRNNIAKLNNTDGAVDPLWDPNINGKVSTIAVNGTNVYAGGTFTTIGGSAQQNLVLFRDEVTNTTPVFISPTPSCGTLFTVDVGSPISFTVAAEDIDAGDVVTLTASGLPSGSVMNPVLPSSGNPVSSEFSWTPDLASVGNHTLTFEITDNNSAPVSCSFNIEVVNNNVPPVFVAPTPVCGTSLTATVGTVFNFTVAAEDVDAGDVINLTSGTLPAGSAMNPVLPASGNPISSDFSWTPDFASVGNHTVTFEITDNYSDPVQCSFNIEVINSNIAPVFVAPTPASGSTLTVYAGSPLSFTVQAEDSDAGNIVELYVAGLPSGAMMNPPLPFAANPVSSDFSWTPTVSDIGSYILIYAAVDNFTASTTCTLTVVVEDAPGIVCPLNQLYWRDNPGEWPVETLILGTLHSYDKTQLLSILSMLDLRDASVILAKQLIAAKLNVANGAPVPVEVANMIVSADGSIRELIIPAGIRVLSVSGLTMLRQAVILLAYNNNLLTRDCSSTLSKQMAFEEEIIIPVSDYTLFDNYPNPFNPSTKIMYTVPNNEFVTLKVYNTVGEEVMTLVNEVKQPGLYEVDFNAASLPSGVYMYRIIAGEFVQTKKMILMK